MKRIGPELRKPELRVPHFLSDLFYDLRDRRLLPLVALIAVAIVAVPFLLSAGAEDPIREPQPSQGEPGASASSGSSTVTVVEAEPGLRNYKKRLVGRKSTNPFKQRFTGPVLREGGQSSELSTSTTTGSPPSTTEATVAVEPETSINPESEPVASAPSTPSTTSQNDTNSDSSQGSSGAPGGFYAFAINLQITKEVTEEDGTIERSDPAIHKELVPPTLLPGKKAPVLTYIGVSTKTGDPMFVVSPEVTSLSGDNECSGGTNTCQLIELEPGVEQTAIYGANQTRYRFKVLRAYPVVLDTVEPEAESP